MSETRLTALDGVYSVGRAVMLTKLQKGIVHPQYDYSVIIYSSSCCFKPVNVDAAHVHIMKANWDWGCRDLKKYQKV